MFQFAVSNLLKQPVNTYKSQTRCLTYLHALITFTVFHSHVCSWQGFVIVAIQQPTWGLRIFIKLLQSRGCTTVDCFSSCLSYISFSDSRFHAKSDPRIRSTTLTSFFFSKNLFKVSAEQGILSNSLRGCWRKFYSNSEASFSSFTFLFLPHLVLVYYLTRIS